MRPQSARHKTRKRAEAGDDDTRWESCASSVGEKQGR